MQEPGWHPDPWDPDGWRWWDGTTWTHHTGGGATSVGVPPDRRIVLPPTRFSDAPPLPSTPSSGVPAPSGGVPKGLLVGGGIALLVGAVLLAGLAVVVLGGGDDGTNPPPNLSDLALGTDPDESAFCDTLEELDGVAVAASPQVWAELLRRLASHAYDDESEALAEGNGAYFQWSIEGQRDQELFDRSDDAYADVPADLCDDSVGTPPEGDEADFERMEAQSEQLAEAQGLGQPGNRFFLYWGMATVVFTDPTEDELVAACEAWGDEPYETLAEDGVLILGQSNDAIDVLQDPVIVRTGVDDDCEPLDPVG